MASPGLPERTEEEWAEAIARAKCKTGLTEDEMIAVVRARRTGASRLEISNLLRGSGRPE